MLALHIDATERDRRRRSRGALVVIAVFAALLTAPLPAAASDSGDEVHCVADVVGILADGEFLLSDPVCFNTFDEAADFSGLAAFGVGSGAELFAARPDLAAPVRGRSVSATGSRSGYDGGATTSYSSSFVIGIHFTGSSGTGSSITLRGSDCSGGYWNASSSWRNVISSSYNGCTRLAHYSDLYISGSRYDTYGRGQTDSIGGYMNNRTKSVRYLGS